jgi:two-component system response regulator RegX3
MSAVRPGDAPSPGTLPPIERLTVGDVTLDRAAHLVTVNGQPLRLALQELRLLDLLMTYADRVLTTRFLLDSLWGPDYPGDPGTLAVHMLRLRKKLERGPDGAQHLRTVRGVGYIFDTVPI